MSGRKDPGPIRACIIANSRSGHADENLGEILPVLLAQGWDVAVREKREKGDAARFAREAASAGYDPIVNCGGDGTLNEVVEALAGTDTAVGTIPGGTENVWSKEIGVSQRLRVAATQLIAAQRVRVDVGAVEINGKHAMHFLMMAGLGADGAVLARVSRPLKNRLGPAAVGVAAVSALPSLRPVPVRARMDDVVWDGEVTQIVVGNTRRYGGFTRITGDAFVDDGLLDVCLFTTHGIVNVSRQFLSMLCRQKPSDASAELYRAAVVTITASQRMPLQVDGSAVDENGRDGEVEYRFTVVPKALTVLMPRTYDGDLFEHGLPRLNGSHQSGKVKKKKGKKS